MIIWSLLILIWSNGIQGTHFNGGSISWAPVYPSSNSSSVWITITQSYSWNSPSESCTTNIPRSSGSNVNLTCAGNCSTQDGFSNMTVSILTDCSSYSASKGLVYSQRSINVTLSINTFFWIAFKGSAWRTLANSGTAGAWAIVSLIDLIRRPDGLINSPPIPQINSPQYVIVNQTTVIVLPVTDANAGDTIRCRWSQDNSTYGVNECASACTNSNITKIANLTDCTLTFTGPTAGVWYALTLQVEDFINTTSTSPMSSIPVQFLISVLPRPNCTRIPVIIPLTGCLEVKVNVPVNFTLYIMSYCNKTISVVNSFIPTVNINYMNVSNLMNSTTNTSLVYVILTWTPQVGQIGSQEFCGIAYTSENVQSAPYCVTFNVTTSIPCATTTTLTTTTTTTSYTSTTTTSTEITSVIVTSTVTYLETSFSTSVTSEIITDTSQTTIDTSERIIQTSETATTSIIMTTTTTTTTTDSTTTTTTTDSTTTTTTTDSTTTTTDSTTTTTTTDSTTTTTTTDSTTTTTDSTTTTTTTDSTTTTTTTDSTTTTTDSTTTTTDSTTTTTDSTTTTTDSTTTTTDSTTTTSTTDSTTTTTESTTTTTDSTTTTTDSTTTTTDSTTTTTDSTTTTTDSTTTTSTTDSTTTTTESTTTTTDSTTTTTDSTTTTTDSTTTTTDSTTTTTDSTTTTTDSTTTTSTTDSTTTTTESTTTTTDSTTTTTTTDSTTTTTDSTTTTTDSTTTTTDSTTTTTDSTTTTTDSTTTTTDSTTTTSTTDSTTTTTESTTTTTDSTTTTSTTDSTTTDSTTETTTAKNTTQQVIAAEPTITAASGSNQTNLPLIAGMSLLGLLVLLCCLFFCIYYLIGGAARRRLHNKKMGNLQKEIDTLSHKENDTNIESKATNSQRDSDDIQSYTKESVTSYSSKIPIVSDQTSANDKKRTNDFHITLEDDMKTPSKQEHVLIKSQAKKASVKSRYLLPRQPKTNYFPRTVLDILKASNITKTVQNQKKSNNLTTSLHHDNETPKPPVKIHNFTLPKNKVAASSSITPTNTCSRTNTCGKLRYNSADNFNSNIATVAHFFHQKSKSTILPTCHVSKQKQTSKGATDEHSIIELETLPNIHVVHKNEDPEQTTATTIRRININIIELENNRTKLFLNDGVKDNTARLSDNKKNSPIHDKASTTSNNRAGSSINAAEAERNEIIDPIISPTNIKIENKRSHSCVNHPNNHKTNNANKSKAKPLVDDQKSPIDIHVVDKRAKSFVRKTNKKKLIKKDKNKANRFMNATNSENHLETSDNESKMLDKEENSLVNNQLSEHNIKVVNKQENSRVNNNTPLVNREMLESNMAPDSNRSTTFVNDTNTIDITKSIDNEDNPFIKKAACENNIELGNNTSYSSNSHSFAASTLNIPDNGYSPLSSDGISKRNNNTELCRNNSLVNDRIPYNTTEPVSLKGNLVIHDGVFASNVKVHKNKNYSYNNAAFSSTIVTAVNHQDYILVNDIMSEENIKTFSKTKNFFFNTINVADNEVNALIDHITPVTNIQKNLLIENVMPATNIQTNLLIDTITPATTIKTNLLIDNIKPATTIKANLLVDNITPTTNIEAENNRSFSFKLETFSAGSVNVPENEDNLLVNHTISEENINTGSHGSDSFFTAANKTISAAENDVNQFIENITPATNIEDENNTNLPFDKDEFAASSSINVFENEDNLLVNDTISEEYINTGSNGSDAFFTTATATKTISAAENEINQFIENMMPAANIEDENNTNFPFDKDEFAASSINVLENEDNLLVNDTISEEYINTGSNSSDAFFTTATATKAISAAENGGNLLVDNIMPATNIEAENNTNLSFNMETFSSGSIKVLENEDNLLVNDTISEENINTASNGSDSFFSTSTTTKTISAAENGVNLLVDNIMPASNTESNLLINNITPVNNIETNILIDNIMHGTYTQGNLFGDSIMLVTNIEAENSRSLSFYKEIVSASSVKVSDDEGKSLGTNGESQTSIHAVMDNGVTVTTTEAVENQTNLLVDNIMPVLGIEIENDRSHSFNSDAFAAGSLKVLDNEDKALVNGGMSETNIEAEKIRNNPFMSDEIETNTTEVVDNENNVFVNEGVCESIVKEDNNEPKSFFKDEVTAHTSKVVRKEDTLLVNDRTYQINVDADNSNKSSFMNDGMTNSSIEITDIQGNALVNGRVCETNMKSYDNTMSSFADAGNTPRITKEVDDGIFVSDSEVNDTKSYLLDDDEFIANIAKMSYYQDNLSFINGVPRLDHGMSRTNMGPVTNRRKLLVNNEISTSSPKIRTNEFKPSIFKEVFVPDMQVVGRKANLSEKNRSGKIISNQLKRPGANHHA